ncbi:unnamed protein product [Urochloa decumbens]|uniref:F-box domain-containing protein n=1 Tax=Urochloa decumbens TaxID=240449 RepID=A0ABC9AJG2_9POAL
MATATAGLSDLPDDILRRILYFAPAKEAASTAILSRRWRSLWRTSGAVNLDSRSYAHFHAREFIKKTQAFAGDMPAALAAAEGPVIRKLTLHVEQIIYETNLAINSSSMLTSLLSSPAAAAGTEELRFVIADDDDGFHSRRHGRYGNMAELHFGDLPSESLRVLHVFNCSTLIAPPSPPAAVLFLPRLAELRLRRCGVRLADLRRIVEAAPQLATLHLECYHYTPMAACGIVGNDDGSEIGEEVVPSCYRIQCPAVTTLVFEACGDWPWKEGGLELDVPRLQYFRYKGLIHLQNRLSLKLPASSSNVIRTDLHFVHSDYGDEQVQVRFWEFIQSFNATKVMKLKLDMDFNNDHVAMAEKGELFCSNRLFYNLERLELEVPCEPATACKTCALFIANLLRCCPVLRDLHLKLITRPPRTNQTGIQARSDFDKSIDHFRNCRKRRKIVLNGEEDETYDEVSDIPGLSDHSFDCLKSYLRIVSLQFWMEEPNCFGVQLAKFFAENAMVLQEISIDDGNHKMREHVNHMLKRWVPAGSSKRKNLLTTASFRESRPRKRQRKD